LGTIGRVVSEEKIFEKVYDVRRTDGRWTPSDGKSSLGLWPGELKRCTGLAVASDKVYQLLAHGRWFSPCTPASSTTKSGRHDIAVILLKVALKHQK